MIIAPAIEYLDYSKFNEQIKILNDKCTMMHINICDGHFVPDITIGSNVFKNLRNSSFSYFEVHLMCDDIKNFTNKFINLGADGIIVPYELLKDSELLKEVKDNYLKVGISVNYDTQIGLTTDMLDKVDAVTLLSKDNDGNFSLDIYEKIKFLKRYREDNNLKYLIEVEGGVDKNNVYSLLENGVDIVVSGSYIFDGNIESNINALHMK